MTAGVFLGSNGGFQNYTVTDNTIRADVQITQGYIVNEEVSATASGSGLFEAILSSSSGGGGGSGGAPSPEINAGLGMLLAGASFVFLRRKRGGRHEPIAT